MCAGTRELGRLIKRWRSGNVFAPSTVEPLYSLADVELEQLQAENRRLADEVSDLSAFIEGLKQHVVAAAKMYGQGRMK